MDKKDLRQFAVTGIQAEISRLNDLLHVLQRGNGQAEDRRQAPKRQMSAAARARISERMKTYWAGRREAEKTHGKRRAAK